MCISLLTTSHPSYSFILLSNRDEYLHRPTARADWWAPPNADVLGGRDLQRAEQGTWLGITRQGRIAVLTNFREEGDQNVDRSRSRGAIVNAWLAPSQQQQQQQQRQQSSPADEEEFVRSLLTDVGIRDVGGFTMLFGTLRAPRSKSSGTTSELPGLSLVSNRTETPQSLRRIATKPGETHGVSNSHFGDASWPKVVRGEALLSEAIAAAESQAGENENENENEKEKEEKLICSLFAILSQDSMPRRDVTETWDEYVAHMRKSILIPPDKGIEAEQNRDGKRTRMAEVAYGTSKQTVMLVRKDGKVVFVERTLFGADGEPVAEAERDVRFEFAIEGWGREEGEQRRGKVKGRDEGWEV